jgi:drug/metabolite transporter (DMT)-like permease
MTFNAVRMGLAAGFLWIATRHLQGPMRLRREDLWRLIGLGIIGNTLYQLFFIAGIYRTKAGNAALLVSTATLLVAILGRITGRERLTWQVWTGIFISLTGVAVILIESSRLELFQASLRGDLLIVAGTACWAVFTVYSRDLMRSYTPLAFTSLTLSFGTLFFLVLSIPSLIAQDWNAVSLRGWLEVSCSAIFALGVAYFLFFYGVSRLGSTRASLYTNLMPLFGLLAAWFFLSEAITHLQAIGGLLIIWGIYQTRRF